MTTLTETTHPGGFLIWEAFRDYTREVITIAIGGAVPVLEPGTVLGKITASGKYAAHDPAAVDGTETAVAVLWGKADATAVDVDAVVLLRGPAIVNSNDLVFTGTPTALEITAAHTALAAVGILTR
jgi:Bacteriophage lambda head decoration protein D